MAWYRLPSPVWGPETDFMWVAKDFAGFRAQFVVFSGLGFFSSQTTVSGAPNNLPARKLGSEA
jgi:hypothetical protein